METQKLTVTQQELDGMVKERALELYEERKQANAEGSSEADWQIARSEIDPFVEVEPS